MLYFLELNNYEISQSTLNCLYYHANDHSNFYVKITTFSSILYSSTSTSTPSYSKASKSMKIFRPSKTQLKSPFWCFTYRRCGKKNGTRFRVSKDGGLPTSSPPKMMPPLILGTSFTTLLEKAGWSGVWWISSLKIPVNVLWSQCSWFPNMANLLATSRNTSERNASTNTSESTYHVDLKIKN
jgi:hypothetical protein